MELERGAALSELKEARWTLDQNSKRIAKEMQRMREQWERELSEKDMLISCLKSEAQ